MIRITELRLPLDHAAPALHAGGAAAAGRAAMPMCARSTSSAAPPMRGARGESSLAYSVDVALADTALEAGVLERCAADRHVRAAPDTRYRFVGHAPADFAAADRPRPVVVGFGPCGLFAALMLAQMGLRADRAGARQGGARAHAGHLGAVARGELDPAIERAVRRRRRRHFQRRQAVEPDQRPAPPDAQGASHEFVKAGAPEEILYVAKPHIGTFRLVAMIEKMRAEITALGGEVRFGAARRRPAARGTADDGGRAARRGVVLADGVRDRCRHRSCSRSGHSARDTFAMLQRARRAHRGRSRSRSAFASNTRRALIDRARFGRNAGHPLLGAADYKLVHHARNGRAVYSFCMCPGGTVVAATSEAGRVVTNGMSQYSRNERNANAGIVVGIAPQDSGAMPRATGAGAIRSPASPSSASGKSRAYALGGGGYGAPAQLVGDFLQASVVERALGDVLPSYTPGVHLGDLARRIGRRLPRLRDRRDPRGAAGVRAPDPRLRLRRRGADRRRDAHLVAAAHPARARPAEPDGGGPLPGRRRRGLCRRDHVGRGRRHRGRRGGRRGALLAAARAG